MRLKGTFPLPGFLLSFPQWLKPSGDQISRDLKERAAEVQGTGGMGWLEKQQTHGLHNGSGTFPSKKEVLQTEPSLVV